MDFFLGYTDFAECTEKFEFDGVITWKHSELTGKIVSAGSQLQKELGFGFSVKVKSISVKFVFSVYPARFFKHFYGTCGLYKEMNL